MLTEAALRAAFSLPFPRESKHIYYTSWGWINVAKKSHDSGSIGNGIGFAVLVMDVSAERWQYKVCGNVLMGIVAWYLEREMRERDEENWNGGR